MLDIAADKGVHMEALRSLRMALTREPSVDQQEVQRAARAVADLPDDVFSSDINNRLMAVILKVLEEYLCRPPESIPARPDPDLLRNLRNLEESICRPVPKKEKQMMTEPMTLKDLRGWFLCGRNEVRKAVLAKYWYQQDGRKYRMRTSDMPAAYHVDRMAKGRPAS